MSPDAGPVPPNGPTAAVPNARRIPHPEGKQGAELKINVDGGNVNVYRYLTLDDGEHLRWKLELKGGKLVGSFSAQHDRPNKWMYDRLLDFTMTKVP
jgi:hypothetical protein